MHSVLPEPKTQTERNFFAKIEVDADGCWIWTGARRFSYGGFLQEMAHVWAYKNWVGPVPEGYQVGHLCHDRDTSCTTVPCKHRLCVNYIRDLAVMTPGENNRAGRGNQFKGIESCKYGHLFTEDNIYWFGPTKSWRGCKLCRNAHRQGKNPTTYQREWSPSI